MLRSLSAAVSGLRNQQTTHGRHRQQRVEREHGRVQGRPRDLQGRVRAARREREPSGDGIGGTNPMEVGLGSQIGTIDTLFTQGNLETTGRNTDLAIQGNSFFVLKKGERDLLHARRQLPGRRERHARLGRQRLRACRAAWRRTASSSDTVGGLKIPVLAVVAGEPDDEGQRLRQRRRVGAGVFDKGTAATLDPLDPAQRALPQNANSFKDMSITVYDSLGTKHELKMVMWKTGTNTWDWKFDDAQHGHHRAPASPRSPARIRSRSRRTARSTRRRRSALPEITFTPNSGAKDVDDQDRPRHGAQRAVAVRRLVDRGHARSGRLHERHAAGLQHRRDGHDRRRLHERHHAGARADSARGLQQS